MSGGSLGVMAELMEEEVDEVVRPRGKHDPARVAVRDGHAVGEVMLAASPWTARVTSALSVRRVAINCKCVCLPWPLGSEPQLRPVTGECALRAGVEGSGRRRLDGGVLARLVVVSLYRWRPRARIAGASPATLHDLFPEYFSVPRRQHLRVISARMRPLGNLMGLGQ
jgi:hypothetical protein